MSNEDKRRRKRFERAHRKRSLKGPMVTKPTLELVYRPKSSAEAQRRENRARRLVGTPFVSLPGYPDRKAVAFVATNGYPVKVEDVEMVFNDAALMDAISNWGEDGPLMYDTYRDDLHREIYSFAQKAYAAVEIPPQIQRPKTN